MRLHGKRRAANYDARFEHALNRLAPRLRVAGEPLAFASLEERMAALQIPGVSIAYMVEGDIVYTMQAGFRQVADELPVTAQTVFQAGSISKPVAMMIMLSLVDDGKLDLDTDVNRYLRSWKIPEHPWPDEKITLRRLAAHSAGTTVHGFPGYAVGEPVPSTVQVLRGEGNTSAVLVDKQPGEGFRYSGGGTTVAQLVMEDISGAAFPDIAAEHLLKPLAMTRSSYEQPVAAHLAKDSAWGYRKSGEAVRGGPHLYPEMAAAGLWTTPSDLLKLVAAVQAIHNGRLSAGSPAAFASKALVDEALSFQNEQLGIGFFLDGEPGEVFGFGHGGADEGFRAFLDARTDGSEALAIMINSDNGSALGQEIRTAIAEEFDWPIYRPEVRTLATLSSAQIERLTGDYVPVGDTEPLIRISSDGQSLVYTSGEDERRPFRALSPLEFFYLTDSRMVFTLGEDGRATGFTWLGIKTERLRKAR